MKGFFVEYRPKYSILVSKYVICETKDICIETLKKKDNNYRDSYPTSIREISLEQVPVKELSVAELMRIIAFANK